MITLHGIEIRRDWEGTDWAPTNGQDSVQFDDTLKEDLKALGVPFLNLFLLSTLGYSVMETTTLELGLYTDLVLALDVRFCNVTPHQYFSAYV